AEPALLRPSAVPGEVRAVVALLRRRLHRRIATVRCAHLAALHASAVAAVVFSVVAHLAGLDDAVAAVRAARRVRAHETAEREVIRRASRVTLRLEERELVHAADGEAERRRLRGTERDAAARRRMQPAEIDREVPV